MSSAGWVIGLSVLVGSLSLATPVVAQQASGSFEVEASGTTAAPASGSAPPSTPAAGTPPPAAPAPAPGPVQPAAVPPAGYYYADGAGQPRAPKRKKGLMIAGLATFGGSYLFTALVGMTMLSKSNESAGQTCLNCDSVGSKLLIPIAGPWVALPEADGDDGKFVCAVLGIAQGVGVALSIAGISQFVSSGSPSAGDASLHVAYLPGGALGSLQGKF